ncbi:MAG: hypothetical protein ABR606_21150 [Vicinamibacterales bacterium]
MSDVDQVLARMETDYDFYLAVRGNPWRALSSFELSSDDVEAFAQSGVSLWSLVLSHTSRDVVEAPDGGLPPPPPPFVVHYSIPIGFEQTRSDRDADVTALGANTTVQAAVRTVRSASTPPARRAAVAQLMEQIG